MNKYVAKIFCGIILFLFSFSILTFAATDDVDVDISLTPRASYFLDEIYEIIVEQTSLFSLGSITLTNTTAESLDLQIRIRLYSDIISSSDPVMDYLSSFVDFPIQIAAYGTFVLTNEDITKENLEGGTLSGTVQNIEDKIEAAYGSDILILTSGMLPEDTYRYEIDVYAADDTSMTTSLGSAVESFYIPLEYGVIDLVYPDNGTVFSGDNQYPQFVWNPLTVRDGVGVTYELTIWKANSYDVESVIQSAPFFQDTTDLTQFVYPSEGEAFEYNQLYVWQVTAVDESGYSVGIASASEAMFFKFGEMSSPEIMDEEQVFDSFPIQLMWSSSYADYTQRIIISEFADGSNAIIDEVVDTGVYQIDNSRLIHANKTYYWQVQVLVDDETSVASNFASFRVNQSIDLIYPQGDELSADALSFYWGGYDDGLYILSISSSPQMESAKQFRVEGSSASLTATDFGGQLGQRYYWAISEVDQFNNETLTSDQVGSFSLPSLDGPNLFLPLGAGYDEKIIFSFEDMHWADSYTIQLYDEAKKSLLWSMDTTVPYYSINLTTIDSIKPNHTYYWRAVAKSASLGVEQPSDYGSFYFRQMQTLDFTVVPTSLEDSRYIAWTRTDLAATYDVYLSDSPRFLSPTVISMSEPDITLDDIEFSGDNLYVKVRALSINGAIVAETTFESIPLRDVQSLYVKTMPIAPIDAISATGKIEFSWYPAIDDAVLMIADNVGFAQAQSYDVAGTAYSSDQLLNFLKIDKTYYWKIVSDTTDITEPVTFKLQYGVPKLISPVNTDVTQQNIMLQWVSDAEGPFVVKIAKNSNFINSEQFTTTDPYYSYRIQESGKWYWKVDVVDSDQTVISSSAVSFFNLMMQEDIVPASSLSDLDYFLKQFLDQDSDLKQFNWVLSEVKSMDGEPFTEENLQYLLENKAAVIRVIE